MLVFGGVFYETNSHFCLENQWLEDEISFLGPGQEKLSVF